VPRSTARTIIKENRRRVILEIERFGVDWINEVARRIAEKARIDRPDAQMPRIGAIGRSVGLCWNARSVIMR